MKNWEEKKYWIWLSLIPDLTSIQKQELVNLYGHPETIYHLQEKEVSKIKGIEERMVKNILDENRKASVECHIQYMIKNDIDIISIQDKYYPQVLKNIYDPPISLYCKGDVAILNRKSIGIIGCREATQYGKNVAKYFSYQLAKQNINIISGLAKGVDSYAHIGTICVQRDKNKVQKERNSILLKKDNCSIRSDSNEDNLKKYGKTVAVLGNGLERIYPKENEFLAKQIIQEGGAILSEYPLGTKLDKRNFPERNRIISGMSQGILVVEAKQKSGTLITVDFALEQGRDVFVVPGNINSIYSVGTNRLIQQGAKLVTNYVDILKIS